MWDAIGGFFVGLWGFISLVYGTMLEVVANPTGHLGTNILAWVIVYAAGWYGVSMAVSMYAMKRASGKYRMGCGTGQLYLEHYECRRAHGDDCWTKIPEQATREERRAAVKLSMGLALLWPLAVAAVLVLGPWALLGWVLWLAVISPLGRGSMVVGESIVTGTQFVSEQSINYIINRAEEIDRHKALTSAKADEEEKKSEPKAEEKIEIHIDDDDPDILIPEPLTDLQAQEWIERRRARENRHLRH